MKNIKALIGAVAASALAASAVPFSAAAEGSDTIYGLMDIPYADFYAAEFEGSETSFEVDAVSSATANKWSANETGSVQEDGTWKSGGLSAGTYNLPNEDGSQGGKILGVTYPVAISEADLNALGADAYNFQKLEEVPAAYKTVTVEDGKASFSKLVDTDGAKDIGGKVTVDTSTSYGDYQLTVENYPQDADVYGVIVKTADGNYYPMRALENLWRPKGQIAWSVGYVTTVHGNNIDNPDYYPTNGATVTGVTFITLDGYRNVDNVNVYLPKMFEYTLNAEDGKSGTGSVSYTSTGIPEDYAQTGSVADGFTAADGTISYTDAQPGNYTLKISDSEGVYADLSTSFLLSTADIPSAFNGTDALVPAEGFKTYHTGKRGTTVVKADGTIDFEAASQGTPVFDGSGVYAVKVESTGYENALEFTIGSEEPISTTPQGEETTAATTASTTTAKGGTTTTAKTGTDSPKTGVPSAAAPLSVLALAAGAAALLRRKND